MSITIKITSQDTKPNLLLNTKKTLLNSKVRFPHDLELSESHPFVNKFQKDKFRSKHTRTISQKIKSQNKNQFKLSPLKKFSSTHTTAFTLGNDATEQGNLRMTWNAGSSQNFTIKKQKKYQSTGALIKFKNTEVKLNLNENEHSEVPKQYEYKKFNSKIRHLKNRSPPKNQRDRKQEMLKILRLKLRNNNADENEAYQTKQGKGEAIKIMKEEPKEEPQQPKQKQMVRQQRVASRQVKRMSYFNKKEEPSNNITGWIISIKQDQQQ